MKTSKEIISLPVLSIAEVTYLGTVKDLLINPQNGTVDFVVVEPENSFTENKLIAFENVVGIGEDALTVRSQDALIPFSTSTEAVELQEKNVKVINSKVMTEKGTLVGSISEILVDEESGKIVGCEWVPSDEREKAGYIPTTHVITYGRDMIIVDKDFRYYVADNITGVEAGADDSVIEETAGNTGEDPLKFFEDKQKEYLIGRKVTARIAADDGEIIAEEGDIVTPEIIEKATKADKYIDLTLNTVDEG